MCNTCILISSLFNGVHELFALCFINLLDISNLAVMKLAYFIIVLNLGLHELSAFESSRLDVNSLTRFYVVIINKVIYPQFELIS
jgi:hypothetical protein